MTNRGRVERPDEAALIDWVRHVAVTLPRDNFNVPAERAEDFLLLYGVCLQSARFANSYLTVRESGFEHEGHALARSAFEHAVTAHWVYFVKGGTRRFEVDINRDFHAYFTAMGDYLNNDEVREALSRHPIVEGKGLPSFTDMMRDLDADTLFLRTSYRTLSLGVHPTHATVSRYIESVDGRTELRHEPRDGSSYPVLYTTAVSAMLALSLVEYIVDPDQAKAMLDEPSERLKLPILINDGIPHEKQRRL